MPKKDYSALLQENEASCKLNCGCTLTRPFTKQGQPMAVAVTFCRQHEQAPPALTTGRTRWTMLRSDADLLLETLQLDSVSVAFDVQLRRKLQKALARIS